MPELTPEVERELAAVDDALAGRRVAPDLTELGELALALRDERSEPRGAFRATLDNKVARGFRDPGPRRRASGRRWWAMLVTAPAFGMAAAVLLVAVVVVTGPHGDDEGGGGGRAPSAETAAESADRGRSAAESAGDESAGAASAPQADAASGAAEPLQSMSVPPAPAPGSPRTDRRTNRAVERSASLTLAARPRDIDAVSARIQDVTRQYRGFVVSSSVSSS